MKSCSYMYIYILPVDNYNRAYAATKIGIKSKLTYNCIHPHQCRCRIEEYVQDNNHLCYRKLSSQVAA